MSITSRIDNVTKIPPDFLGTFIPAPKSVKIELTGKCNYRCGFCALRTRSEQPKEDMDLAFFKEITTDMADSGVKEIGLFYLGESFMNPELLIECILFLKQELGMPYVFLTTNGSLANPGVVHKCMEAGLDSLKFSMNAADPEQFQQVMGVKTSLFTKSIANLQAAKAVRDEGGYTCGIYASSIQYDGAQAERMKKMLESDVIPYVDQHYFLPLYGQMTHFNTQGNDLGYVPTAGNQGRIGALREPLPCWSVFTEGHVRSDGVLSACCFDSDGRFHMENLHEVPFMEGWNSLKFLKLRSAHITKDVKGTICEDCIAYA